MVRKRDQRERERDGEMGREREREIQRVGAMRIWRQCHLKTPKHILYFNNTFMVANIFLILFM